MQWIPGTGKAALVVHPDGSAAARASEDVAALLRDKRPVLMIDAFQTGNAKEPRKTDVPHFATFNRSEDQLRVQDIITALRWLETKGHSNVELIGLSNASIWTRFAAAVAPVKVTLNAKPVFFNGADTEFVNQFFVPGIQRAGGWKTAMTLTAER
jgi:hypothetical protein